MAEDRPERRPVMTGVPLDRVSDAAIQPNALFRSISVRARTPLARSMVSGAVVGIFSILFYLSYAALIFSGPLTPWLGYGMAAVGRFAMDVPATVPPWAVAVSLGVSGGIGLLFGIYPAARASRLDPAVALRDE